MRCKWCGLKLTLDEKVDVWVPVEEDEKLNKFGVARVSNPYVCIMRVSAKPGYSHLASDKTVHQPRAGDILSTLEDIVQDASPAQ